MDVTALVSTVGVAVDVVVSTVALGVTVAVVWTVGIGFPVLVVGVARVEVVVTGGVGSFVVVVGDAGPTGRRQARRRC